MLKNFNKIKFNLKIDKGQIVQHFLHLSFRPVLGVCLVTYLYYKSRQRISNRNARVCQGKSSRVTRVCETW